MRYIRGQFGAFSVVALIGAWALLPSAVAHSDAEARAWSVFAYGGVWNNTRFEDITKLDFRLQNTRVWSLGVSRTIHDFSENLLLEGEVNVARHSGKQHHSEVNTAASLRWKKFPWDQYVDTSFAYGLGLSYATKRPPIEDRSFHEAARLLVFMPVEITFAPPKRYDSPWETFLRVHHRSGAFGLVSNARGSDFVGGGIRYRF